MVGELEFVYVESRVGRGELKTKAADEEEGWYG
jgi:hypothetical protein